MNNRDNKEEKVKKLCTLVLTHPTLWTSLGKGRKIELLLGKIWFKN